MDCSDTKNSTDWEVGSFAPTDPPTQWSWCDDGAAYHDLFRFLIALLSFEFCSNDSAAAIAPPSLRVPVTRRSLHRPGSESRLPLPMAPTQVQFVSPLQGSRLVLLSHLGLAPQAIVCHASGVPDRVPYNSLFHNI
jgi:hypothetical protein